MLRMLRGLWKDWREVRALEKQAHSPERLAAIKARTEPLEAKVDPSPVGTLSILTQGFLPAVKRSFVFCTDGEEP